MAQIDWTAIIVALVGSGGLLAAIATARLGARRTATDRAAEERATATVSTPVTGPPVHDVEAFRMAQQAMHLANNARKDNEAMRLRLDAVEAELTLFRRSYRALYEWAQKKIIGQWGTVRLQDYPPALPPDIHHPDN